MSNELVRAAQKHIATADNSTLKKEAGKGLVTVGAGGLVLGMLPFISLPIALVLAVILGIVLWVKG